MHKPQMSPLQLEANPLLAAIYTIGLFVTMLAISAVFTQIPIVANNITKAQGRYGSLDGLRGMLSVAVFIYHSFIAYVYFTQAHWQWSSSAVFNHLGQTSVTLFFMITGFLFALKAVSARIDWIAFYVSRWARLFPLYGIVVCVLFSVVLTLSRGVFYESIGMICQEFIQWLSLGSPNVNAFPMTHTLIAGVNWTLKYEVMFYIVAIPLLHFISKFLSVKRMLFCSTLLMVGLLTVRFYRDMGNWLVYAMYFLGGIIVAYAYRQPSLLQIMQSYPFRIVAGASVFGLAFFQTAGSSPAILIAIALFAAMVGGLSLGGLLNTRAALWLGDISYGIYLIHGLVLWLTLFAYQSWGNLANISWVEYGLLMVFTGSVAISLASLSYLGVEKPAMDLVRHWAKARSSDLKSRA